MLCRLQDLPLYAAGISSGASFALKLPRNLKPAQVSAIRKRLDALTQTPLPIPKGPLPKGMKMPRG